MRRGISDKKIGDAKLAKREPAAKHPAQYFIRDRTEHFKLKVTERSKYFVWEARINGKLIRKVLGEYPHMTLAAARTLAEAYNRELRETKSNPFAAAEPVRRDLTLGELIEIYMTNHSRKHNRARTIRDNEWYVKAYLPNEWRERKLAEVRRPDIEALHTEIGTKHGPYAANHFVRFLRSVYAYALDDDQFFSGKNPARVSKYGRGGIKLYPEEPRENYLGVKEIARVNDAIAKEHDWRWRAFFPLLLMTGCRSGEMKLTQWDDINWESKEIVFPATNTKAKRAHRLPLPDPALEVLTDLFLSRTPAPWIFPANQETGHTSASGHIEEPKIAWNRIREAAGVPKCRIHDLRHTLASHMAQAGHTMDLIRRILNHKDSSITARYAHLDTETMRKCLNQTIGIMLPNGLTPYVPPQDTVTPGQPDEVQALAGEPVA